MQKIVFFYSTGFCGSDGCELIEFPDNCNAEDFDTQAYNGALENAEMYGIYPMEAMPEDYDDEDGDEYSNNIEGSWVVYDPVKHDGMF